MSRPTNILVLMADQHRQDCAGCYGHPVVRTPHIDALAAGGTRFENAFCTSPLCGPSRGSFLTGTHPHTNGLVTHPAGNRFGTNKIYHPQLQPGIGSLAASLRDAGFRTHASGYIGVHIYQGDDPIGEDPDFNGFQTHGMSNSDYAAAVGDKVAREYHMGRIHAEMWEPSYFNVEGEPFPGPEEQMFDRLIAADANTFLRDHGSDGPFCLYVGFRAPHPPWRPPERFLSMYDPADIGELPDWRQPPPTDKPRRVVERHNYFDINHYSEEMVRRSIAAYYAFVSYTDDCVGSILNQLDELGLREDTLIVFSSDHGENLYHHGLCEKHTFYEDAVHIPLIMSAPGHIPAGQATDSLVSIMDILPTALAVNELPIPAFVEGLDLRPAARGETLRDHVLAEYYHSLDPCRMIRDQRWKYITTEGDICELYDLDHDPDERVNLAWYEPYRHLVDHYDRLVHADWEIPEVPLYGTWNDLNIRKQRQRLAGMDIVDPRPPAPEWPIPPSA